MTTNLTFAGKILKVFRLCSALLFALPLLMQQTVVIDGGVVDAAMGHNVSAAADSYGASVPARTYRVGTSDSARREMPN